MRGVLVLGVGMGRERGVHLFCFWSEGGLKLIKMAYLLPIYGQNMDFSLLAEYIGYI